MKKIMFAAAVVLILLSLYSCNMEKKTEQPSTEASSSETVSAKTTEFFPENTTSICSISKKGFVELALLNNSDGSEQNTVLTFSDSESVNSILSKYQFAVNPYDNINDMMLKINGKRYAYDSDNGIFTYSSRNTPTNREQTVKLGSDDRIRLNKILSKYQQTMTAEKIISDTFIVKEINSTLLTLAKYDRQAGELKEGLFRGDYGRLENADRFNIKVGDILMVYYEREIAETYPYQIKITDIVFAGL